MGSKSGESNILVSISKESKFIYFINYVFYKVASTNYNKHYILHTQYSRQMLSNIFLTHWTNLILL